MEDELDPSPETPEISTALHAGRTGAGRSTLWRAGDQKTDADGKVTRFILYSGREVRYNPMWQEGGDIIRTREFVLKHYRACNVVLADHHPNHVVGVGEQLKIVEAGDDGYQLHGASRWDLHESNPLGILIGGQHARGLRHAVSIGFMPGKGSMPRTKLEKDDPAWLDPEKVSNWRAGWVYRYPELYEFSSVSVPKDPGALQLQSWAAEAETDEQRIQRLVSEIVTRQQGEWILQAIRSDPQIRAAIIAAAWAQAPAPSTPQPSPATSTDDWFTSWE
jgi:hypothetical protein